MCYSHNFENKNSLLEMDVGVEGSYGIIIFSFLPVQYYSFLLFRSVACPCSLNSASRVQRILAPKATVQRGVVVGLKLTVYRYSTVAYALVL